MRRNRVIIYFVLVIIMFFFNFYFRPISGNKLITKEYKNSSKYINNLYMSDEYFKTKILKKDEYHIYDTIKKASLKDEVSVTIKCNDCTGSFSGAYNALYLDHPELISFMGISYYKIYDDRIEYDNLENLGRIRSTFGAMRIEREMENIRNDTKNMSDKDKIIYVYDYVASHNYDTLFTYIGSNQSAYSFFTKKSSVCAGFAKASQIIFQNIGINSYLALSSEHMWNYVEYEGKYYIFDATVGASYYDKKMDGYYDGLEKTTTGDIKCMYYDYYPEVTTDVSLKELFGK